MLDLSDKTRLTYAVLNRARKVALANGLDWRGILRQALRGNYLNMMRLMDEYFTVKM